MTGTFLHSRTGVILLSIIWGVCLPTLFELFFWEKKEPDYFKFNK